MVGSLTQGIQHHGQGLGSKKSSKETLAAPAPPRRSWEAPARGSELRRLLGAPPGLLSPGLRLTPTRPCAALPARPRNRGLARRHLPLSSRKAHTGFVGFVRLLHRRNPLLTASKLLPRVVGQHSAKRFDVTGTVFLGRAALRHSVNRRLACLIKLDAAVPILGGCVCSLRCRRPRHSVPHAKRW